MKSKGKEMKGKDRHRKVGMRKEKNEKVRNQMRNDVHAAQRESTYYLGITLATRLLLLYDVMLT